MHNTRIFFLSFLFFYIAWILIFLSKINGDPLWLKIIFLFSIYHFHTQYNNFQLSTSFSAMNFQFIFNLFYINIQRWKVWHTKMWTKSRLISLENSLFLFLPNKMNAFELLKELVLYLSRLQGKKFVCLNVGLPEGRKVGIPSYGILPHIHPWCWC